MIGYTRATFMLALSAVVVALVAPAGAQTWPSRPIRLIVPHAPGGVTDVVARLVAQPLGEALGQSVIIENKPGASGLVGTESAASAAPDGYTFVMFVDANTILPSTVKQLNHDPLKSFAPITVLGRGSHVIVAHPSLGVRTLPELVRAGRREPGRLNYASVGKGSVSQLSMELLMSATGMQAVHVPYSGGALAVLALVAGDVQLLSLNPTALIPQLTAGKVVVVAQTSARRSPLIADVPTVAESGYPGFEAEVWIAIVAPAKTPAAAIARLHAELAKIIRNPAMKTSLWDRQWIDPVGSTPAEAGAVIARETAKWAGVVESARITVE